MKNKVMKKLKSFSQLTGAIVIGVVLGISLQFVSAWVEPNSALTPPNGNIGGPINSGPSPQFKEGPLIVKKSIQIGEDITPKCDSSSATWGVIQWTGSDFEGCKSGTWVSLTGGGSVVTPPSDPGGTCMVGTGLVGSCLVGS